MMKWKSWPSWLLIDCPLAEFVDMDFVCAFFGRNFIGWLYSPGQLHTTGNLGEPVSVEALQTFDVDKIYSYTVVCH